MKVRSAGVKTWFRRPAELVVAAGIVRPGPADPEPEEPDPELEPERSSDPTAARTGVAAEPPLSSDPEWSSVVVPRSTLTCRRAAARGGAAVVVPVVVRTRRRPIHGCFFFVGLLESSSSALGFAFPCGRDGHRSGRRGDRARRAQIDRERQPDGQREARERDENGGETTHALNVAAAVFRIGKARQRSAGIWRNATCITRARAVRERHLAIPALDELRDDREPEPGSRAEPAAVRPPVEALEDARRGPLRGSRVRCRRRRVSRWPFAGRRLDRDVRAGRRVAKRVLDQVVDDMREVGGVGKDERLLAGARPPPSSPLRPREPATARPPPRPPRRDRR